MATLSNQLATALSESEVYVDENGYARDDEGNMWFVGKSFANGIYHPRSLPPPPGPAQGRQSQSRPGTRPKTDNSKRIEAFQKLPAHAREGSFGRSTLQQLKDGRTLSDAQLKVIRQMFYKARNHEGVSGSLRDLADLFR